MARSLDAHQSGCPCPVCNQGRGRSTTLLGVRLPLDLAAWVRARGGPAYLRALAEEARQVEQDLADADEVLP